MCSSRKASCFCNDHNGKAKSNSSLPPTCNIWSLPLVRDSQHHVCLAHIGGLLVCGRQEQCCWSVEQGHKTGYENKGTRITCTVVGIHNNLGLMCCIPLGLLHYYGLSLCPQCNSEIPCQLGCSLIVQYRLIPLADKQRKLALC